MKKYVLYTLCAALMIGALPAAANADPHGWRAGDPHRDGWYFHPRWVGNRYVVAPVPVPVYVAPPYYYGGPPAPVYYAPPPGISLSIAR